MSVIFTQEKNEGTYSDLAGVKDAYAVITNDSAEPVCGKGSRFR